MSVVNQLKLPIVIQLCLSCQLEDVWEAAAIRSGGRGILVFFFPPLWQVVPQWAHEPVCF